MWLAGQPGTTTSGCSRESTAEGCLVYPQLDLDHDKLVQDLERAQTVDDLANALHALHRLDARRQAMDRPGTGDQDRHTKSTVNAYLNGRRLVPTDKFDRLVTALGAGPEEQHTFATARDRVEDNLKKDAGDVLPAPVVEPVGPPNAEPAAPAEPSPRHRRRWALIIASIGTVVSAAVAIPLMVGNRSEPPMPEFTVAAAPTSPPWAAAPLDCRPQRVWSHTYPGDHRGDVYIQLAGSATEPITTTVTWRWGGHVWQQTVDVMPGQVTSGQGGTLIATRKLDKANGPDDLANTFVEVETDVPVCAAFGTTQTRPIPQHPRSPAAPSTGNANRPPHHARTWRPARPNSR